MPRSLHPFARSPHLRMLAWLAWLVLALVPVHAAMGNEASTSQPSAAMPMAGHAMHDMAAAADDCCTGQALHAHDAASHCHCAATCASVMPALAMAQLLPVPLDAMPVPRHGATAPSPVHPPPLRPPLLQASRLA